MSATYSPSYAGQLVWRSVVATRPQGIVDNIMVLMGEGRFFGLVPMGEGHTYGFGALNVECFEDPLEGRLERFRRRFAEFATPVSSLSRRYSKVISSFISGRSNGSKSTLGIEAAWSSLVTRRTPALHTWARAAAWRWRTSLVLAEELRKAKTVETALESYVRRRRPRADWVQAQSRAAAQAWVLPPSCAQCGVARAWRSDVPRPLPTSHSRAVAI